MKSYYVISSTEGCATNLQENNSYRKDYEAAGYKAAQSAALADVILVNTCAYSQQMETVIVILLGRARSAMLPLI